MDEDDESRLSPGSRVMTVREAKLLETLPRDEALALRRELVAREEALNPDALARFGLRRDEKITIHPLVGPHLMTRGGTGRQGRSST